MTDKDMFLWEPELEVIRDMLIFVKYHPSQNEWEYACKHFQERLPDGKPGCAIHETRPKMCSEFPRYDHTLIRPECGYWEERAWDERAREMTNATVKV
jgi:Fe-S-cluster containining protein